MRPRALALTLILIAAAPAVAQAAASAPYFTALPASGSTELQTAREGAVTAPLPNGQVLIAGGYNSTNGYLQSAELFNPATSTFTVLTPSGNTELQTAREGAMAAPLPNGEILIAGGFDGPSALRSAELFNPANDTFAALPASDELQTARAFAAAAPLPNGDVLIAGGTPGGGYFRSAELFNPVNDSFTALAAAGYTELQTPRAGAGASPLPSGQVLIVGGADAPGTWTRSAELFDPVNDTFAALPATGSTELQTARESPAVAALPDGRVLIAGGFDGAALGSAELFNPGDDSFSTLWPSGSTALQTARFGAATATLPSGQVLIAGGSAGSTYLQSAELYVRAPEAAMAGGDFGDQTVGQPSGLQTLVVTNVGAQALRISGASLPASDFTIAGDACSGRTLAFEQSCTITVRFTPSTTGARTATITLSDNEPAPSTIALSGTGVAANSGPVGPAGQNGSNGAQGPLGPAGPPGAQGKPGQIELVTCTTVTRTIKRHGKRHTVTRRRCVTKLISGTATFTTTTARATLSRAGTVYATGTAHLAQLVLHERRQLRPGTYTLTLTRGIATTRQPITIA